jgi:uncharacterized membrane protein SirB2
LPLAIRALIPLLLIAGLSVAIWSYLRSPTTPMLRPESGAVWIRAPHQPSLAMYPAQPIGHTFTSRVEILEGQPPIVLSLRAARKAEVYVDTRMIFSTETVQTDWNRDHRVGLPGDLPHGVHPVHVRVTNDMGPPAFRIVSDVPDLRTGSHWGFTQDGRTWTPVVPAAPEAPFVLDPELSAASERFRSWWPALLGTWLVLTGCAWAAQRTLRKKKNQPKWLQPGYVRLAIYLAFTVLLLNNGAKLKPFLGMDSNHHVAYMAYIAETRSLPPLEAIPQAFQAPLYYMLGAPVVGMLDGQVEPGRVERIVAMASLLFALGILELTYRILRRILEDEPHLQIAGMLCAASLPMLVTMAHFVSNEILVGLLGSAVLLLCVHFVGQTPDKPRRAAVLIGAIFGLALLAKTTAILLAPAVAYTLLTWLPLRREALRPLGRIALAAGIAATVVGGWFYLRNALLYGSPFIGGWDPATGFAWWQEPAFREPGNYLRFGSVFQYPLYAGMTGFWDGLYATFWTDGLYSGNTPRFGPGWNLTPLLLLVWCALVPCAALLVGAARVAGDWLLHNGPASARQHALRLSLLTCAVYLAALLWHHMHVPIYSNAKGTYFLSALPCVVLLILHGARPLLTRPRIAPAAWAALLLWVGMVYAAFAVPYHYENDPRPYRAPVEREGSP